MRDRFYVVRMDMNVAVWRIDFASPHQHECDEFIRSTNSLRALKGEKPSSYDVLTLVEKEAT